MSRKSPATAKPGSLNRAARLLDALAREPDGSASIPELAQRSGVPRPTAYRVADQLVDLGWLQRCDGGRVMLGARLALLGQDAFAVRLQRAADAELTALARSLGHTIYLDVQAGPDLICLARYHGDAPAREVNFGYERMRLPFGVTPATMAMLAVLPDAVAREIIATNNARYAAIQGFDSKGFLRAYERARRSRQVAYDAIILDRRMCGLGVAICDRADAPVAGIGMAYARTALGRDARNRCLGQLAAAAARIEARLWGSGRKGA